MGNEKIQNAKKIILQIEKPFDINYLVSLGIDKKIANIALIELYNNGKIVKSGMNYKSRSIIPRPALFIF